MEYAKLDAGLRLAMRNNEGDPGHRYIVFIHTAYPPETEEIKSLQAHGISGIRPGKQIITATIPAETIRALSDLAFVTAIRLSRVLKPVRDSGDSL